MVRVYYQLVEAPLHAVVRMASLTPAAIIRQDSNVGSLEKGKLADVIVFDDDIEIRTVFVGGSEQDLPRK
jgi:N-acetylglucosamine-6-phosphate deacetylase